MHIMDDSKKVIASAFISELQSSEMYLTLVARLFDLRANLNGVRVTEAFLDEIIENEQKYVCHPLYADIRGLLANKTVGHMYNKRTGEFYSTQIGAFYHFEKEMDDDGNAHLLGYARVPKRNKALCKVLSELFTDNALKFSFELNCGTYTKEADGTLLIDADEKNYWEGECVVTFPACETAIAKQLVAECLNQGDENMADENIVNAENEQDKDDVKQIETAKTQTAESEIAQTIHVTQTHMEHDCTRACDYDTGEEVIKQVTVETVVRTPVELAEDADNDKDDERQCAADDDEKKKCAKNCDEDDKNDGEEKQFAQAQEVFTTLVGELKSTIRELREEIAGIKAIAERTSAVTEEQTQDADGAEETIIAGSVTGDTEQEEPAMNPFMASISTPAKYSLLAGETKTKRRYSLLDRA